MSLHCPICEARGYRGNLEIENRSTQLIPFDPFFDKKGRYHFHDPNEHREEYRCDRDPEHFFTRQYRKKCWCGWHGKYDWKFDHYYVRLKEEENVPG